MYFIITRNLIEIFTNVTGIHALSDDIAKGGRKNCHAYRIHNAWLQCMEIKQKIIQLYKNV